MVGVTFPQPRQEPPHLPRPDVSEGANTSLGEQLGVPVEIPTVRGECVRGQRAFHGEMVQIVTDGCVKRCGARTGSGA
jgi:hypothetical protein